MLLFHLVAEHSGIALPSMDTRGGDTEFKIYAWNSLHIRIMSAMT